MPDLLTLKLNYTRFLVSRAGWSSLVARQAHNLKVVGSNPTPATINEIRIQKRLS